MGLVVFCAFLGSKWCPIEVYMYSSTMLGRGSYIGKLVCTAYAQQQMRYNAAQVLRPVATLELLALFGMFGYEHFILLFL